VHRLDEVERRSVEPVQRADGDERGQNEEECRKDRDPNQR